jgi:hypothetical protein
MKIFQLPIEEYYIIAAFLTNLQCIMYANQTADYFGCTNDNGKMNLQEYIGLVRR